MEFQEKRKIKKILYSKVVLFILIVLISILLFKVWDVYKKQSLAFYNLSKAAASLEGLQVREKMLLSEIQKLKTEAGAEAEIREKYGLVKPSEEVILIVDGDQGVDPNSVSTPISFWQKVLDWLR
jgi:cell division protein FtsB